MLSIALMIITATVFVGIIIRTKSKLSGRKGPSIFQPLKDIYVLFNKSSIFSRTTSFIFQMAPAFSLATVITAMLVVPFVSQKAILSFEGDFIFFAYILALGKFFQIIGALDTGSSFQGMGAEREALFSMLIEPAFFVLLASLAMLTGNTSFQSIFSSIHFGSSYSYIVGIIAVYLFIQIAMIENSRVPIDDPKTHLELTMIHEVMVLDNCGFDLALIHIATYLKFAIYGLLIANAIIPATFNLYFQIAIYFAIQIVFALIVGFLESFKARNRMKNNPRYVFSLTTIALLAFVVVLLITHKLV